MAALVRIEYAGLGDCAPNSSERASGGKSTEPGSEVQVPFNNVATFAALEDNCAIATRTINKGTKILMPNGVDVITISHKILEGHRFAAKTLFADDLLLSWGLRFGRVVSPTVKPGEYMINNTMIDSFAKRGITDLPDANFVDEITPYTLAEEDFNLNPPTQVPLYEAPRTFFGFKRLGSRGTGTRNYVVILGTSSLSAPYARELARQCKRCAYDRKKIDGIVPIAHTEGTVEGALNRDKVIRTLAGFVVHPNVGAVVLCDFGYEDVSSETIISYQDILYQERLGNTRFAKIRLGSDLQEDLAEGKKIIQEYLAEIEREDARTEQPFNQIKIALQCGGSDAFSGVSANPTVGNVAKEVIRNGGGACLAETDELIGAESHVLAKVRSREVAQKFLATVEWFKNWMSWHGQTAENNPSGGNQLRGIYNITLKSIGAGMKKPKDVRLDHVIDYGELQPDNYGYTFMNSPGNDLESVSGQVATGCNFILFTTGNGAVTNHPLVPTIKILTTTRRYELLKNDMDFNAGRHQDPASKVPIDELGQELLELLNKCASGKRTVGEIANHAQVQIWRNWAFQNSTDMELNTPSKLYQGNLQGTAIKSTRSGHFDLLGERVSCTYVKSQSHLNGSADKALSLSSGSVALVVATSLCSSEVSQKVADALNKRLKQAREDGASSGVTKENISITRFVACAHTEGCGSAHTHNAGEIQLRVLFGHLMHPNVSSGFLIEHGCEKNHNDYFRQEMAKCGMDPRSFGWASVQLGGGLDNVMINALAYFFPGEDSKKMSNSLPVIRSLFPTEKLRVGIFSVSLKGRKVSVQNAIGAARFVQQCLSCKALPIMASTCPLLKCPKFLDEVFETQNTEPTLSFAQQPAVAFHGLHIMNSPTNDVIETCTAFAAAGSAAIVIFAEDMKTVPGHPFVPVILCNAWNGTGSLLRSIVDKIEANIDRFEKTENEAFQIARGLSGISV